ncbi:hypothetical protein ACS7SF_17235 [Ralstonia sp. 25C]|uniref:hypothetical protein n=1 Tax=Ralstonia sp. 25C TaxID=3447363 RepID=UPI003F755318
MKLHSILVFAAGAASFVAADAQAVDVNVNLGMPTVVQTPVQPVIAPGWQGDRYWDGHRYWTRQDWESHGRAEGQRRRDRDEDHRCPPGHRKKHEC